MKKVFRIEVAMLQPTHQNRKNSNQYLTDEKTFHHVFEIQLPHPFTGIVNPSQKSE